MHYGMEFLTAAYIIWTIFFLDISFSSVIALGIKLPTEIFHDQSSSFIDIISDDYIFHKDNFSNGHQYSVCDSKAAIPLSDCLRGNFYNTLKTVVLSPKNYTEVINSFIEVSNFYQRFNTQMDWTPYFFVRIPLLYDLKNLYEFYINNNMTTPLPISTEIYFVQTDDYPLFTNIMHQKVTIYELYSIKNMAVLHKICNQCSMQYVTVLDKSRRRSNLYNEIIVGLSVHDLGYELATAFSSDENLPLEFVGGFEVEEFWYLRDAMNFTARAMKTTAYVREGPNGTLTGLAVPINNQQADLAISATEFLEYRLQGKDGFTFLHPTFENHILAFFKQPPASSIRDIFLAAFTIEVWIVFNVVWILFIITLYIFHKVASKYCIRTHVRDDQIFEDNVILAVGMCSQQGWHTTPILLPVRIVFFSGWFLGLLYYIGYSAALVSILSVEVVPIHSFEDLLNAKFFIYSDSHIPTTKFVIKDLESKNLIPKLPEAERNVDVAETIERILKSKSTVVTISDSFYPILQKQDYTENFACTYLSKVSASPRGLKSSMFVKRGSPFRELFNYKILFMHERGIRYRLMSHYITETSISCLQKNNGFQSTLGIKDLFTAFGLLGSGFAVSFFILLLEKVVLKSCTPNQIRYGKTITGGNSKHKLIL